jgi:hypothetical protein
MKGKSDYASFPLSDAGLSTLMNEINRRDGFYVICEPYGGAIADIMPDSTAFAHRSSLFCLEYVSEWIILTKLPAPREMRDSMTPCGPTFPVLPVRRDLT